MVHTYKYIFFKQIQNIYIINQIQYINKVQKYKGFFPYFFKKYQNICHTSKDIAMTYLPPKIAPLSL